MPLVADQIFIAGEDAARVKRAAEFAVLRKVDALALLAALVVACAVPTLARCVGRTSPAGAVRARRDAARGALDIDTDESAIATAEGGLASLVGCEGAARACARLEVAVKAHAALGERRAGRAFLCASERMAARLARDPNHIATDLCKSALAHGTREIDTRRAHQEGDAGPGLCHIEARRVTEPGEKGRGRGHLGLTVFRDGAETKRREARPAASVGIATRRCKVRHKGDQRGLIQHRGWDHCGRRRGLAAAATREERSEKRCTSERSVHRWAKSHGSCP